MELLSPLSPVAFDRRHPIAPSSSSHYYSAASTTSSSSPDRTTPVSTVSTALTNLDSDNDDEDSSSSSNSADSSRRRRHHIVPKIEEPEEDKYHNDQLHALQDAKSPVGVVLLPPPRKRGRPRKHPIVDASDFKRTSHARSKTGCGTCRRRKKKCDETKPVCLNCEKNNVVCAGYEPKQPWRSGKQRALQLRQGGQGQDIIRLPSLEITTPGLETSLDRDFFTLFTKGVGDRLSLTDTSNPFQDFIVPMAITNPGLMHSVLFLTSTCYLAHGPGASNQARERREHHRTKAMEHLLHGRQDTVLAGSANSSTSPLSITAGTELAMTDQPQSEDSPLARIDHNKGNSPDLPVALAHALILCLETVAAGNTQGEYRIHVDAMKNMLMHRADFPDERLRHFILEFLLYHDYSSSITSLIPTTDDRSLDLMKDFELPTYMVTPAAGSLLGVMDGLFGFMSRIRRLRDNVRTQRNARPGFCWLNDVDIQTETYMIDEKIREWECRYDPESPRLKTSLLYRQCVWVYLWRTVFPSRPHVALNAAVDDGLRLLNELPSGDIDDTGATQSVLLMPVFLLGCAAFEQDQRREIGDAFYRLKTWSRLGNIHHAEMIVREVWDLMDQGREDESWDWEMLIYKRGWDLLIT